jgi:hypothetical protein
MRLEVLQRDHYRCRRCNKGGDEITPEVCTIREDRANAEEVLTLCVLCRNLVEQSRSDPRLHLSIDAFRP